MIVFVLSNALQGEVPMVSAYATAEAAARAFLEVWEEPWEHEDDPATLEQIADMRDALRQEVENWLRLGPGPGGAPPPPLFWTDDDDPEAEYPLWISIDRCEVQS